MLVYNTKILIIQEKKKTKTRVNSKSNVSSLATTVPCDKLPNYKPCKLCMTDDNDRPDHSFSRCPNFPNSFDKMKRLNELKGCTKCSSLQHKAKGCTTHFAAKCSLCSGLHLTILCLGKARSPENSDTKDTTNLSSGKGKKKKSNEKQGNNNKVENGIAYGVVKEGSLGSDVILPTITGTLLSPTDQEKVNVYDGHWKSDVVCYK